MNDHNPPVDWPSCSCTRTCSSIDQPWPPTLLRAASRRRRPASIDASRTPSALLWREAAAGALELDLDRLEHVAREAARALLELELGRAERQVHAPRMAHAIGPPRPAVAGRGTPGMDEGRSVTGPLLDDSDALSLRQDVPERLVGDRPCRSSGRRTYLA